MSSFDRLNIKTPNQLLYIDDTYYSAGRRYERGILCDVYVSKRTDYKIIGFDPEYYLFELYLYNKQIPISIHITAPDVNLKFEI